jgi:hypothetical protein
MVRPTALAVALADGLAGTALAASASAGCDVVRYEIKSSGAPICRCICPLCTPIDRPLRARQQAH